MGRQLVGSRIEAGVCEALIFEADGQRSGRLLYLSFDELRQRNIGGISPGRRIPFVRQAVALLPVKNRKPRNGALWISNGVA